MKNYIKKLLNERIFDGKSKGQLSMLDDFIMFSCDFLGVDKPQIQLQYSRDGLVTTASYDNNLIKVYINDRALVDVMRSIAHELTHYMQDKQGRLNQKNNMDNNKAGSPIEDEANSKAGEIIRKYGETHPEIYL